MENTSFLAPLGFFQQSDLGMFGDFVGGTIGTALAACAAYYAWKTWVSTEQSNRLIHAREMLSASLTALDGIVAELEFNGKTGRAAFGEILSEFNFIYSGLRSWEREDPRRSLPDTPTRIDLAMTVFFFGIFPVQREKVSDRFRIEGASLFDALAKRRNAPGEPKSTYLQGHQKRLGHYFRCLYGAYAQVKEDGYLTEVQKKSLGKIVRVRLSNYEQALLALNMLCYLGRSWRDSGICDEYQPIKNIPESFFSFDSEFDLRTQFEKVEFEFLNH